MEIHKIINAFHRKYPTIDNESLTRLLMSDPTSVQNSHGSFAGRYGVWIANMYANGSIKLGDIPELNSALVTYDKNRSQLPDIKGCGSLGELIDWVKDLSDDFKPVRKQSNAKSNLEKVYEDGTWVVYVPHSHEASRRGGEGTHWCTASENPYYYNMYSKQGSLYINLRKSDNAKFQFHFETMQFMDSNDNSVRLNTVGLSTGITEFYSKINMVFGFLLRYDYVGDFYNGYAKIELNNKWNYIDTQGKLVSPNLWFDAVYNFSDGCAEVKLNNKYNYIDTQGKLLSPTQWFDGAGDFYDGYAEVKLNSKWNFIDTQGKLVSPNQWFDDAGIFLNGYAKVKLNNKWNFIDTQGKLLSPNQWFDYVGNFLNGYAVVILNNKYNLIDTQGKLVSPNQWFDNAGIFLNGYARIRLSNKYNFIDTQGKLLFPNQWFDAVGNFSDGYAPVKLSNKWNLIDTQGKLVSPNQWFDDAEDFSNGYAKIKLNGKWHFLKKPLKV